MCSNKVLGGICNIAICILLQLIGTLVQVSMPQNGITADGIAALARAFGKNPNLQIIDLNDNTFTQEGACAMAEVGLRHSLSRTRLKVFSVAFLAGPTQFAAASGDQFW